jgi:putative Mg2+ transporter-C (MgtC) family protein
MKMAERGGQMDWASMANNEILQMSQQAAIELWEFLAPIVGPLNVVVIGRLVLALLLCGLIGLERSSHERASGFRPHILVGLGACLMTQAGGYGFSELDGMRDPMRLASYVISGIGFLGAGAILRHGTTVRGLTTAASIWGAAGIGVASGVGLGGLAVVTALLFLFTLITLERLEVHLSRGQTVSDLNIHLVDDSRAVGKTLAALARLGVPVKSATMLPGVESTAMLSIELNRPLHSDQLARLVERLLTLKHIMRVDTQSLTAGALNGASLHRSQEETPSPSYVQLNLEDEQILLDLNEQDLQDQDRPPRYSSNKEPFED